MREHHLLREAETRLESENVPELQETLLKLLGAYQKQARRMEKILIQSDKQQEQMLVMNEELEKIRNQQAQNITQLIEDKKVRAKNIIESKKKIFELHKQELVTQKSSIDELTRMILEKDQAIRKLHILQKENQKLKSLLAKMAPKRPERISADQGGLNEDKLKEVADSVAAQYPLESDLLEITRRQMTNELDFRKIDNFFFAKNALPKFNSYIQKMLEKYDEMLPVKELSAYLFNAYQDELLYVLADHLIELICERDPNATRFVNFFNGEVAFASDGSRYQKPDIKSPDGTRWNLSTIHQVALQRKQAVQKVEQKTQELDKVGKDIRRMMEKLASFEKESQGAKSSQQQACHESIQSQTGVGRLRNELLQKKNLFAKASGKDKDVLDKEIKELSTQIRDLQKQDDRMVMEKKAMESTSEQIEIKINMMRKELEGYQKMYSLEQGKLQRLTNALQPAEEKYNLAVSALAHALVEFKA